jgi:hypothetical protein
MLVLDDCEVLRVVWVYLETGDRWWVIVGFEVCHQRLDELCIFLHSLISIGPQPLKSGV